MRTLLLLLFGSILFVAIGRAQGPAVDSLQQVVRENKQDAGNAAALNLLAAEYTRTDMTRAKGYLFRAIELGGRLKSEVVISYAYGLMLTVQQNTGHPDSAVYYLQLLKKIAEASDLPGVKGNFYGPAGLFYKKQGKYKEALPYLIAALNMATLADKNKSNLENRTSMAGQSLNIGNTYMQLGEYKNALTYHLKALQLFEAVGNQKGQSFCYQSIGNDFINLRQYRPALDYTLRSIALKKQLNDRRGLAVSTNDLAEINFRQKKYDAALQYYLEGQKIFHDMKLTGDEAKSDLYIGKIYGLKKDPAMATTYFQNARSLAESAKDSALLTTIDEEAVALQTDIEKQRDAETKLMSSLRMSMEQGDKSGEVQSYQYLADHYTSNRQFDKALEYTNKLHQVTDSLQSQELELQISRMEKQYNFDKKEREIELLKKDQQLSQANLQRQKNLQVAGLLLLGLLVLIAFLIINRYRVLNKARRTIDMERMRNTIARDLHDDIGSMLTSIHILSQLTLSQAGVEPGVVSNLQKIKDRSAAIMESMWDIVWAINPKNDTLAKMASRMKEFAAEILEPLNISYHFTGVGSLATIKLDVKRRKDFYLFFKEAVNNAAKYSQCRELVIDLRQEGEVLHLGVTDNGKGFDLSSIRSSGNGINNMQERARSMQAEFQIDTKPGEGTRIRLDVPVA